MAGSSGKKLNYLASSHRPLAEASESTFLGLGNQGPGVWDPSVL
jgi:hypothetical protein